MEAGNASLGAGRVDIGREMHRFIAELYPICRSITGNGVRETFRMIQQHIPLTVSEVPSGTEVFDWTIPKEWNILDAYIKNVRGERIVDFRKSNLHVVSYSIPVKKRISLQDLRKHLFSLPEFPDRIPYRTSYYKESWGFCLSHNQLEAMQDQEYDVCIDASLENGALTYGECVLKGESSEEVLVSCHICHPSLCNDNLSGIALAVFLAKALSAMPLRYSFRFLFIPGTIGSIAWLARNETRTGAIKHGVVVTGVGDGGQPTYKKSRRGNAEVDRAFAHVLQHSKEPYRIVDFSPYGYDERQYCSPGFDLPVGCFMRSSHGQYTEYHTSADNLEFVKAGSLEGSLGLSLSVLNVLQNNRTFVNKNPKCEPQLGKRGLYRAIGGQKDGPSLEFAMLWVLNLSDGQHSLLDIAERSGLQFELIKSASHALATNGLLTECGSVAMEA